jgi:hypothetical protein
MNVVKLGTILRVDLIDVLLSEPFSNDENVHPSEQSEKENKLRDELEAEVEAVLKVQ